MANPITILFLQIVWLALSPWAMATEPNERPHNVLVETEISSHEEYPLKIKGTLLIEAPPQVLWEIITDYEHLEGIFPGLVKSQILSKNTEIVVEQQYQGYVFLSKSMIFKNKETPMKRIDFKREGGKTMVEGAWVLEPVANGWTLLIIDLKVRPRRFLFWIIESMIKKQIPQGLISIRNKSLNMLNKNSSITPETVYIEKHQDNPSR